MTYYELGEFISFAFMVGFCLNYGLILLSTLCWYLIDSVKRLIGDLIKLGEAKEVDE